MLTLSDIDSTFGNGTPDDDIWRAAFDEARNDRHFVFAFPEGGVTSVVDETLEIPTGVSIVGQGDRNSHLVSNANPAILFLDSSQRVQLRAFSLEGHAGHLLTTNRSVAYGSFAYMRFIQRSERHSILFQESNENGGWYFCEFRNNRFYHPGNTVPSIYISGQEQSFNANAFHFNEIRGENDNHAPWFYCRSRKSKNNSLTFSNTWFEKWSAGQLHLHNVENVAIDMIAIYDTHLLTQHGIYIENVNTTKRSPNISIRNHDRRSGALDYGVFDIYTGPGTANPSNGILLENCGVAKVSSYSVASGSTDAPP